MVVDFLRREPAAEPEKSNDTLADFLHVEEWIGGRHGNGLSFAATAARGSSPGPDGQMVGHLVQPASECFLAVDRAGLAAQEPR